MGMSLIPLGVKEKWDWWHRCLEYYRFTSINANHLTISTLSTMQYGWALYRLIREVVISYPDLAPVYVTQDDTINGFYRINLGTENAPKMGLVSP